MAYPDIGKLQKIITAQIESETEFTPLQNNQWVGESRFSKGSMDKGFRVNYNGGGTGDVPFELESGSLFLAEYTVEFLMKQSKSSDVAQIGDTISDFWQVLIEVEKDVTGGDIKIAHLDREQSMVHEFELNESDDMFAFPWGVLRFPQVRVVCQTGFSA